MTDINLPPYPALDHEKVAAIPDDWHVVCPDCNEWLDVGLSEKIDGSFSPEPEDTFIQCDCGKLIEVTGSWRNLP